MIVENKYIVVEFVDAGVEITSRENPTQKKLLLTKEGAYYLWAALDKVYSEP